MALEYWLITDDTKYQFPVISSDFSIEGGQELQDLDISAAGQITLWGPEKLRTLTIESFFPDAKYKYPFCQCTGYPTPWDSVKMINTWKNNGKPIRFLITGTDVNMLVFIDSFSYGIKDGTSDVYFSLTIKEYKQLVIPKVSDNANTNTRPPSTSNAAAATPAPAAKRTHTVVAGDCLWNLAKQYYGDGNLYWKIADANTDKISDPNFILDGWVLVIP